MKNKTIDIYTDGACSGNPGPGGWAAILRYEGVEKEISGFEFKTTNNRMELMAAIKALETITKPLTINIHTDSKYVMDGITKWIVAWKKKDWRTSTGAEVKNLDLWQELDVLSQRYTINWVWVKGHSGHPENDRADLLARNAIVSAMMIRECS
jgi:ribonuclease HI